MSFSGRSVESSKRGNSSAAKVAVIESKVLAIESELSRLATLHDEIAQISGQLHAVKADLSRVLLLISSPGPGGLSLSERIVKLEEKISRVDNSIASMSSFMSQVGIRIVAAFVIGIFSGGLIINLIKLLIDR